MTKPCPICDRPVESPRYRPFCSQRCADVDLGHWFTGQYTIPGPPESDEESSENDLARGLPSD